MGSTIDIHTSLTRTRSPECADGKAPATWPAGGPTELKRIEENTDAGEEWGTGQAQRRVPGSAREQGSSRSWSSNSVEAASRGGRDVGAVSPAQRASARLLPCRIRQPVPRPRRGARAPTGQSWM
eukprot:scaffold167896_cov30-Tisochrysis_lutea.AAC.2